MSFDVRLLKRKRWMLFVDGENLTIEAQKIAAANGLSLVEGKYFSRDVFLWFPNLEPKHDLWLPNSIRHLLLPYAERAYYYTCLVGADDRQREIREKLWQLEFEPEVFKKPKDKKAKGVDITLTKDVLGHAFRDNYEVAVLIAGDGDYLPLIREVKRLGKSICICYFQNNSLNDELRLSADCFLDLQSTLISHWRLFTTT